MSALDAGAHRALHRRRPLPLDPARSTAIKRNTHHAIIEADAARFAEALRCVMIEPGRSFGAIELRRAPERVGQNFEVGERFCGCFRVDIAAALWSAPPFAIRALGRARRAGVTAWLENRVTCDFAEISRIDHSHDGRRFAVSYRYLSGSPIAGESTYVVTAETAATCRFEQIFHYQELGPFAVQLLHRLALALHDEVFLAQATAAAHRLGAGILHHTIRA